MSDQPGRFRIPQHVAWELIDDGSVMFCHLPSGEFGQMAAPAGHLWELMEQGTTVDELAAVFAHEGASPEEAAAKALEYYTTLAERDLLADAPE